MRIDRVLADLGVADAELSADESASVAGHVEAFLRGGGVVSLTEWSVCSPETRGMLVIAGDRIRGEHAALVVAALLDEGVREALLKGEDVEAMAIRQALRAAVSK